MRTHTLHPAVLPVLLAVPGIGLAIAGLFHPHALNYETSGTWFALHIPGLLFFPLIGVALAALVTGRRDPLAWFVRLAAYVYATFYSALDVINGIAAGYVTREMGPGYVRDTEVSLLFRIGGPLGEIGSWALLACAAGLVVDQVVRHGARGLPSLVLLVGAWLVHTDHIFSPYGVAGMALLGLTTAYLAWVGGLGRPAAENGSPSRATSATLGASKG